MTIFLKTTINIANSKATYSLVRILIFLKKYLLTIVNKNKILI